MSARFSTCWVVTDGKAGMESQCVGLAEALGLAPQIKRVKMREPWRLLSPHLRTALALAFESGSALAPPWPDLLIASGRLSVPASLYVRAESRRAGKPAFTVQIQDPVVPAKNFDLVIAPLHDGLEGENVISTLGALHRVTPEKLAQDAQRLASRISPLPPPYIGVLIGGSNASYRLDTREMSKLALRLTELAGRMRATLVVTPSRRTGEENIAALQSGLRDAPAFVWDGTGENPYFGILGLSDFLVVTADSVNMISEACASAKPVYIYDLPGGSRKSARFLQAVVARGLAQRFGVPLERYPVTPLREMDGVVEAIRTRVPSE